MRGGGSPNLLEGVESPYWGGGDGGGVPNLWGGVPTIPLKPLEVLEDPQRGAGGGGGVPKVLVRPHGPGGGGRGLR